MNRQRQNNNNSKSCLLLPHGSYSLFVAILCTLGWLACLFQDGCDYAHVMGPVVQLLMVNATQVPPWLEFGIGAYRAPALVNVNEEDQEWVTSFGGSCTLYPPEFMDTAWTTSRVFSFLSLVLGGGGTLFLWCSTCFIFGRGTWRWTGYEILLASSCQGLSFLWFMTEICQWNQCSLFWGSKADIAACILWLVGGMLVICRYPQPEEWQDDDDNDNGDDETGAGEADMEATMETPDLPATKAEMT